MKMSPNGFKFGIFGISINQLIGLWVDCSPIVRETVI